MNGPSPAATGQSQWFTFADGNYPAGLRYLIPMPLQVVGGAIDDRRASPLENALAALIAIGTAQRRIRTEAGMPSLAVPARVLLGEQARVHRAGLTLGKTPSVNDLLAAFGALTGLPPTFRTGAVWLGGNAGPEHARWVGVPATAVVSLVSNLLDVWSGIGRNDVQGLAAIHAQLTAIHPFRDGNGRMARWLAGACLTAHGYPLAGSALTFALTWLRYPLLQAQRQHREGHPDALAKVWVHIVELAGNIEGLIRQTVAIAVEPDCRDERLLALSRPFEKGRFWNPRFDAVHRVARSALAECESLCKAKLRDMGTRTS